jgi:hypothetical protein
MAAQYPNNIVSFSPSTVTDYSTTVLAEHVNTLREEVIALQSNLGTLIKTGSGGVGDYDSITVSWNSLKDRLANIEYGLTDVYTDYVSKSGGSSITSSTDSTVSLNIKAKSGQTADLLTLKNSSNSTVTKVTSSGNIYTRDKELVPIIYAPTQPTGSNFAAGTVWIDSSVDVDVTVAGTGAAFSELMLIGA